MKTPSYLYLLPFLVSGCVLSSCVYRGYRVPEMPYKMTRPAAQAPLPAVQQPVQQPVVAPGTWVPGTPAQPAVTAPALRPLPVAPAAPAVAQPVVRPAIPATPAPRPTAATSSHITQPFTPPVLTPAPVVTPPAAAQPPVVTTVTPPSAEGQAATPTDPKLITNTGPIPVAMRVEGDPIRVYNPLDHTKTIRIIDPKTGKVHPSGKVLKVKGTNFKFIVP